MIKRIKNILKNRELSKIIEWIIIGLTILDIVILTSIFFVNVSPEVYNIILIFDLIVVIILMIQFIYELKMSDNRSKYLKANWFNLLGMIPEILLGGYLSFLRYFRLIKILSLFRKNLVHFMEFIEKTHLEYGIITLVFILISGASIFYFFEFGVNPYVNSLDDALWYVLTTITTVGFGDIYPYTVGGRLATAIIIVAGLGFISYVAAGITSWFMESSNKNEKELLEKKLETLGKNFDDKFNELHNDIKEMKELLKKK